MARNTSATTNSASVPSAEKKASNPPKEQTPASIISGVISIAFSSFDSVIQAADQLATPVVRAGDEDCDKCHSDENGNDGGDHGRTIAWIADVRNPSCELFR